MKKGVVVLLLVLSLMCYSVFASVDTIIGENLTNFGNTTETYNFTSQAAETAIADLLFNGSCSPDMQGCTKPYALIAPTGGSLMGLGPMMTINDMWALPSLSQGNYQSYFPLYQVNDGLSFITADGLYIYFVITSIGDSGENITFDYKINSIAGNTTIGVPTGCAADYQNESECVNAMMTGIGCFWDSFMGMCRNQQDQQQEFMFNPGCFIFDGNEEWCEKITGCSFADDLCDPDNPSFMSIQCSNISNSSLCEQIPMLDSCCEWTGSSCVKAPTNNTCYESAQPEPGHMFCDDWAVLNNETACNATAGFPYFMPCKWDTTQTKCSFKFDKMFDDGFGEFEDIQTQQSCEAAGGEWKTKVFVYTDSYGEHTDSEEWCEMKFGMGSGSCDTSCWACEFQPDGSNWADVDAARNACENSAVGMCSFFPDNQSFNGLGFCDFPHEMKFSGAGDCNNNCGACNFMNNPETSCNASQAGCGWVTITTSQGVDQWCESDQKKTCADDCFQCYDNTSCIISGKGGDCTWDKNFFLCKPNDWGDREICFDGIDNDEDGNFDCGDSDCKFDQFCGGSMFIDFEVCYQWDETSEAACESQQTDLGENCTWVNSSLAFGEELCEFPGEGCWAFESDNETCLNAGCDWKDKSGCAVNMTLELGCWDYDDNQAGCTADGNCTWISEGGDGFCELSIFATCKEITEKGTCNDNPSCAWMQEGPFNGWCDPICFNESYHENAGLCNSNPFCQVKTGFCGPEEVECWLNDGNQTACDAEGILCQYKLDPRADNSVGGSEPSGWCDPAGAGMMFDEMQGGDPIILGFDGLDNVNEWVDIQEFGLKDMGDSFAFGIPVEDLDDAAFCNDIPKTMGGTYEGTETGNYYIYLDSDGSDTNNCKSHDSSYSGFEFYFGYESSEVEGELAEKRTAFRCMSGNWTPTPIIVSSKRDAMCRDIDGPMLAIDKESLRKFTKLYNESQDMRLYVVTANETDSKSSPTDTALPGHYTPGTIDFKFECCSCPGQDIDGDGFTSEQDPDCKSFNQFGYIPMELGPQCNDNIDNDGNNLIDCNDPNCKYDPFFCGGSFAVDATDKKTPSLQWLEVEAFDTFAIARFDTNEPANGTLKFFHNDSVCSNLNKTMYDVGIEDSFTGNEYKPWHDVIMDNENLGYSLDINKTYYYKLYYCDPSDNCGLSACMNFTTSTSIDEFVFDFEMPNGFEIDIPQLGISNANFNYGSKTNASAAKNINITIKCEDEGYELTFVGVNLKSAKDFNLSSAFVCGESDDSMIGMNSSKWQDFLQDTGVKYIRLRFPLVGEGLQHCDDNGENCKDVSSLADCTFAATYTECVIPVATGLGFSTYAVNPVTQDPGDGGSGGSSSGTSSTSTLGPAPAPQNATNKLSQSMSFGQIQPGDVVMFKPNSDNIPVDSISFESKSDIGFMTMMATAYENKPEEVMQIKNAYRYLELSSSGFIPTDVKDGKIEINFNVEKKWVEDNAADKESVYLYRYYNGVWTKLNTKCIESESDFYEYISETPGFSYFSIAADPVPELIVEDVVEESKKETEIIEVDLLDQEIEEISSKPKPVSMLISTITLFVAAALLFFHQKEHKKPKTKEKIEKPKKGDFLLKKK